jgi:hypothetical protein
MHEGWPAALFSIVVIAALLLALGGVRLLQRGDRPKGVLMLVAALVLVANVLIWTL